MNIAKVISDHKRVQHTISECINRYIDHLKRDYKYHSNTRIYENKSYQNTKRIIRLTESDLINIVKQCLFESTKHAPLLTESAQDKRVQKFLKSKGYSDYNERMDIIGRAKHELA